MRRPDAQRLFIRSLRNNPTPAERKLWAHLSARQLAGYRFNRQVRVGGYVIDLASRSAKLAIELDGDSHATTAEKDAVRTAFLQTRGYRVIRFANFDVMSNVEGAVAEIERALAELPSPSPSRMREGNSLLPPSRSRVSGRPCSQHGLNDAGHRLPETGPGEGSAADTTP